MPVTALFRWLRFSPLFLYRLVTWTVLLAGVVFVLLVLSLRYWILPGIDEHRDRIAHAVTKAINQRITIGKISSNWDRLRPELVLEHVTVFDASGRPVLGLSRIDGTLSWLSVAVLQPIFHSIEIHEPALEIRRDKRGVVSVAGIEVKQEGGGGFVDWLLRQRQVAVRRAAVSWYDELREARPLELREVELLLRNSGTHHRFGLSAVPPAHLAGRLDVRGDLTGKTTAALAEWNGKVFVQVDHVDLGPWSAWLPSSARMPKGRGALRAWAIFRDDRLAEMVADVQLADIKGRFEEYLPELDLVDMSGRIAWKQSAVGLEISTSGFSLGTRDGLRLRPTDFFLRLNKGTERVAARGELRASGLDLEPLAVLADHLPLDAELRKSLVELAPRGRLSDMVIRWNGEWNAPTQYVARGRFHALAMNGFERVPGFSGLSGSIDGNEKSGTVQLESQKVALEMPLVFSAPIGLDKLTAQVAWTNRPSGPEFKLSNVAFSNAHLAGSLAGTYQFAGGQRGVIDISGHLTRADARYVSQYVPLVIGKSTRDWLDRALIQGRSKDVSLKLKGDLSDFPFADDKGGVFQVVAKVTDGVLDYAAGWPRIENIAGEIVFHGKRMDVNARQGTILGARLAKVHAVIPDLVVPYEILTVAGEAEGPTSDFLAYIEKSPVLGMIDRFTEGMRAQGTGKLALKLEIPLREHEKSKVAGSYQFSGNNITLTSEVPLIEQASGRIEFTESSVRVPNATGLFLGGPFSMSTAPQGDATARINAQGRTNVEALRQAAGNPWWMQPLRGAADWQATLVLRQKLVDIVLDTNLQGVASELPAPFAKASADAVPLRLERKFIGQPRDQIDQINFSYGELMSGRFVRRPGASGHAVHRGTIRFGSAAPEPEREGVWVSGALKRLDVDRWFALVQDAPAGAPFELAGVDLKIGEALVMGRTFHEVTLSATTQDGTWRALLAGRQFEGTATWQPQGSGKLTARMKRLFIPSSEAGAVATDSSARRRELPALDVTVDELQVKERALGKLELTAAPVNRDWRIERLRLVNADSVLTAEGLLQSMTSKPRTRLVVHLEVKDIGRLLTRMQYPEGVRRGTAKVEGTLAWPGAPQDFEYHALSGNLTIEAAKGQFLKLEPGIGKLLGILSLQSLPRRIALDFRDVFSEGFAFDQIAGSVAIDRGIATTENFRIQGPAARVLMSGEIDLARETQKLHVRVEPSLSDSVSIAGAVLGGPVAGVAAIIAQKVLKDPLSQIFAFDYNVTGTWVDPQVAKVERPAPLATEPQ